jgi:hypothetical protein
MSWREWFKAGFTGFVALSATYTTVRFFLAFGVPDEISLVLAAPVLIGVLVVMIRGFNPKR